MANGKTAYKRNMQKQVCMSRWADYITSWLHLIWIILLATVRCVSPDCHLYLNFYFILFFILFGLCGLNSQNIMLRIYQEHRKCLTDGIGRRKKTRLQVCSQFLHFLKFQALDILTFSETNKQYSHIPQMCTNKNVAMSPDLICDDSRYILFWLQQELLTNKPTVFGCQNLEKTTSSYKNVLILKVKNIPVPKKNRIWFMRGIDDSSECYI